MRLPFVATRAAQDPQPDQQPGEQDHRADLDDSVRYAEVAETDGEGEHETEADEPHAAKAVPPLPRPRKTVAQK